MDLRLSSPSLPRLRAVVRHPPLSLLRPFHPPSESPSTSSSSSSSSLSAPSPGAPYLPPAVTSLSFHSSGRRLYVAYADGTVRTVNDVCDGSALEADDGGATSGLTNAHADVSGGASRARASPRDIIVLATHHAESIVVANGAAADGTGGPAGSASGYSLQYMSVHDNKILRTLGTPSAAPISSLSASPVDDRLLSSYCLSAAGATDGSGAGPVMLWDLRQASPLFSMDVPPPDGMGGGHAPPPSLSAFDDTGLVFCVAGAGAWDAVAGGWDYKINMYDSRNYSSGPFAEMTTARAPLAVAAAAARASPPPSAPSPGAGSQWTSLRFNRSGSHLLVAAVDDTAALIDGYTGAVAHAFSCAAPTADAPPPGATPAPPPDALASPPCFPGPAGRGPPVTFSRDDAYVVAGRGDGTVACWETRTGSRAATFDAGHVGRVGAVATNPVYGMFVSGCANVAVWV